MCLFPSASGLPSRGQWGGEEPSADVWSRVYNWIHRPAGTSPAGRLDTESAGSERYWFLCVCVWLPVTYKTMNVCVVNNLRCIGSAGISLFNFQIYKKATLSSMYFWGDQVNQKFSELEWFTAKHRVLGNHSIYLLNNSFSLFVEYVCVYVCV